MKAFLATPVKEEPTNVLSADQARLEAIETPENVLVGGTKTEPLFQGGRRGMEKGDKRLHGRPDESGVITRESRGTKAGIEGVEKVTYWDTRYSEKRVRLKNFEQVIDQMRRN